MLPDASFFARSPEGIRISHVAKLRRQKYRHGMPTDLKTSSKASFLMPASLLVFRSVTTKGRIFGSNASVNSGISRISFFLQYGAYFPTRSFSYSLADFFFDWPGGRYYFWLLGFLSWLDVYWLQPIYLEGGFPCLMKRGRFVMLTLP